MSNLHNGGFSFSEMEILNSIIADLYDHSLSTHARINRFFKDIASFVYFDRASIMLFYKDENGEYQKQTSFTINWDKELLHQYDAQYSKEDDTLAPLDRPEPFVLKSSSFFNAQIRETTEYWKRYLLPNNAYFEITANLQLDYTQPMRANWSFTRGREAGDFTDHHIKIMRLFQPHLSALIREYIRPISDEDGVFTARDYNCIGYCILDENCQIIRKNKNFDRMNAERGNQLLNKIVQLCIQFNQEPDAPECLTYEYKFENNPLFLELTKTTTKLDGNTVQFCCLVYDLSHFFMVTLKQLKRSYHLSEREYEILVSMLQGMKHEEIAGSLYLSVPSVKKYVASVYNKLGITNQKQLFTKLHLI